MRFKIFFSEQKQELDINCLNDSNSDKILPENVSQHVYYPIPNELKSEIKHELMQLLDDESAIEYNQVTEDIRALTDKRRAMINELRMKLNPKIIQLCDKFKEENAEYFI